MRINDANLHGPGGVGGNQGVGGQRTNATDKAGRGDGRPTGKAESGQSEDGDRFQLSSLGSSLRSEDIGSPERQARVEQLRAEFKSGKYNPDNAEVAKSIVADALGNGPGGGTSGGGTSGSSGAGGVG